MTKTLRAAHSTKNRVLSIVFFFIAVCAARTLAGTGMEGYAYERALSNTKGGWQSIALPATVVSRCQSDLRDLRILALNSNGDSIEIPYLLRSNTEGIATQDLRPEIINIAHDQTSQSFMLHNSRQQALNSLELEYPESNFEFQARLEASDDREHWLTVVDSQRFVAVSDEHESFCYSNFHFPTCNYRWLRIRLLDPHAPIPSSVLVRSFSMNSGDYEQLQPHSVKSINDAVHRLTRISLDFNEVTALSAIDLAVSDPIVYRRLINIYRISDSIRTPHGNFASRELVYSGVLSSSDSAHYLFTTQRSAHWEIEVVNGDNLPLHVELRSASCQKFLVVARFPAADIQSCFLVYGDASARAAEYDIAAFRTQIPTPNQNLELGPERARSASITKSLPLLSNPLWMWSIIVVVVLSLGYATLRMLRSPKSQA